MHKIKSMTGYGKSERSNEIYNVSIELKSVNNRYLDINLRCPSSINYLDTKIRNIIKSRINRGRVEINIIIKNIKTDKMSIDINSELIKSYKDTFDKISLEISLDNNLGLNEYLKLPNVITEMDDTIEVEILEKILFETLDEALKRIIEMREKEAENLLQDIVDRIEILKEKITFISKKSDEINVKIKEEYILKVKEFIKDANFTIDEDRINQEIVILSEKSDITEEITRLNAHIENFINIIEKEEIVGRKLDFLIQEMNREINTIGSKTSKIDITETVIDFKSELEKIRQQIQNIE